MPRSLRTVSKEHHSLTVRSKEKTSNTSMRRVCVLSSLTTCWKRDGNGKALLRDEIPKQNSSSFTITDYPAQIGRDRPKTGRRTGKGCDFSSIEREQFD